MVKQVITGRVEPLTKESIKILAETEGVTVGALLEMALNLYVPVGTSAREWQIGKLTKQLDRLVEGWKREHEEIDDRYNQDIERIKGHLAMIRGLDECRVDKVMALIPRWITCHDLGHRRSDPGRIIKRKAKETPLEQVPWFSPFGITINWVDFQMYWMKYEEGLKCTA
jgi:hypothetical protein